MPRSRSHNLADSGLIRRTASYRTSRGKKEDERDGPILAPSPRIPTETLDRIIELALEAMDSFEGFKYIAPLTLVSSNIRQIALCRYFHDISVENRTHWKAIFHMLQQEEAEQARVGSPGCFKWIRTISTSSRTLSSGTFLLSCLPQLRVLNIDFSLENFSTQHPRLKLLADCFGPSPLHLTPCTVILTSLTLTSLPRIDVHLLQLAGRTFPRLINLSLSCVERLDCSCCWICFEDSLSCVGHSPIPGTFADVSSLAVSRSVTFQCLHTQIWLYACAPQDAFADALKPLVHLKSLHLGVFLSNEQLVYTHIDRCIAEQEHIKTQCVGGKRCTVCAQAFGKSVRTRELEASLALAQGLKALQSISWASFSCGRSHTTKIEEIEDTAKEDMGMTEEGNAEDADASMRDVIWVLRDNGRIRVRRRPW